MKFYSELPLLLLLVSLLALAQGFMPMQPKKRSTTSKDLITIRVPDEMAGTLGSLGVFDP